MTEVFLFRACRASWLIVAPTVVGGWMWSATEGPAAVDDLDQVTVYFQAYTEQGTPVSGLRPGQIRLLENGVPQNILNWVEASPGARIDVRRRNFVLQLDDSLSLRELFRAKRAAQLLVEGLRHGVDRIAVFRDGQLSGFFDRPKAVKQLIAYFGTEYNRYRFSALIPRGGRKKTWFSDQLPGAFSGLDPGFVVRQGLEEILRHGTRGSFSKSLGRLKHLPGRNILIHFGKRLPYRPDEAEHADVDLASRLLNDANFTVYPLVPDPDFSLSEPAWSGLDRWARATGGKAICFGNDFRLQVRQILEETLNFYRLAYRSLRPPDSRYRKIEMAALERPIRLIHRNGYFATAPATLSLVERTFFTVFRSPGRYRDFPINLSATQQGSLVRAEVKFPLANIQLESPRGADDLYRQTIHFFVGVYDDSGWLLAWQENSSSLQADPVELAGLARRYLTLDKYFEIPPAVSAAKVQAIVISGQNRQIATQVFHF